MDLMIELGMGQQFFVMAWRRTGAKSLQKTKLIRLTDAYMRHPAASLRYNKTETEMSSFWRNFHH